MSKPQRETVPITAADMERFHRNAWSAIRRRQGTFLFDEFGNSLRAVIVGGVPLVGLLLWNWSALQLLVFYLVGSWVGILCDFAKLSMLEKQIKEWGEAYYDDWHVWVVVDALRAGEKRPPRAFLRAKYEPWSGVLVDFAFGGISTILMIVGLIRSSVGVDWAELPNQTVLFWLAGVTVYQIAFTVWEIWEQGSGASDVRNVKVAIGMRGLGLFMFMFLLVFVTDGFEHTGSGVVRAMVAVNGLIVIWGLGTMLGPLLLVRETRWLKKYMQDRDTKRDINR